MKVALAAQMVCVLFRSHQFQAIVVQLFVVENPRGQVVIGAAVISGEVGSLRTHIDYETFAVLHGSDQAFPENFEYLSVRLLPQLYLHDVLKQIAKISHIIEKSLAVPSLIKHDIVFSLICSVSSQLLDLSKWNMVDLNGLHIFCRIKILI